MRIIDRIEYRSKPKPLTMDADDTVADAVAAMSSKNYGSVVITDGKGGIAGLVTERDVMKRLVNEQRDPKKTKLSDIMTTQVKTANEDDDVRDWLRVMSNERFRRLPVVDGNGRLIAMMTQGDFVSYTWPELLDQITDKAAETVGNRYQLFLIGGGVLLYSLVLVFMLGG
ncbi:MAG: CBS domain-containing protein [Pseudomonadota bacterium]